MKLQSQKIFAPERQILAIPDHYVALTGVVENAEASKLLTASAIHGGAKGILRGTLVHLGADGKVTVPKKDSTGSAGDAVPPNAIIFNSVMQSEYDETDTLINVTVLVHGFVREDRLIKMASDQPALEAPQIYVLAE